MTDTTTGAKFSDLPPHVKTVSADTAQLRDDLDYLRRGTISETPTGVALSLIDRLLSIVERMEDRALRR